MGFTTGLGVMFARDVPFYAFFFGTYEIAVNYLKNHSSSVPVEAIYFTSGGLAGEEEEEG